VLNSNTWLNNDVGVARPESKYFFPGFNIGGPVLIPHTNFNKNRDKLFFFSGFEAYVQTLDTGLLGATVANAGMQQGNFSPANLATAQRAQRYGQRLPFEAQLHVPRWNNPGEPHQCQWLGVDERVSAAERKSEPPLSATTTRKTRSSSRTPISGYRASTTASATTPSFLSAITCSWETQQFPVTLWWRNGTSVPYPTPILGKNQSQSVSTSLTHVFSPTMSNEFVFAYTYIDFPNVFQNPAKVSDKAIGNTFTDSITMESIRSPR
jgi:hypothetical protein